MGKLYLSHRLDSLAKCLADQLHPCARILVPNLSIKQWLSVKLALLSKNKGIAGVKICSFESLCPQVPSLLEMQCLIYSLLSPDLSQEVAHFLSGCDTRRIELSERLAALFSMYLQYGLPKEENWQTKLLFQVVTPQRFEEKQGVVHCFGFDFLPPRSWQFIQTFSSCHIYLFSPCRHFWEDLCSDQEQRRLSRKISMAAWEEMEKHFVEAPPLLANLGKLGRETLKTLDAYPLEIEEVYEEVKGSAQLQNLQKEILSFEKTTFSPDDSIILCKAGSSRWKEIEWVREEILSLGIPFSEIAILAPDPSPYIPIIEYLFAERIPCRFSAIDLSSKSPFYRGLSCLAALAQETWTSDLLVALMEAIGKMAWVDWIQEMFTYAPEWEKGFEQLLLRHLSLTPGPAMRQIAMSDMDSLEELLEFLQSLEADLGELPEQTLESWSLKWNAIASKYLKHHLEEDTAAWETFRSSLRQMREIPQQAIIPFALVAPYLLRRSNGPLRGNHLHAVRIESLEDGSCLPAKVLFLIGMDEESFPRKNSASSLDLLKKESKTDTDRYLFLRALFSAEQYLRISYRHLAEEDGKPVSPSLVVQELVDHLGGVVEKTIDATATPIEIPPKFFIHTVEPIEPCDRTVSLADLTLFARNPWKYHLQKAHRIFLNDRSTPSFSMQRTKKTRASLQWPLEAPLPGLFQEALFWETKIRQLEVQKQLHEWGKEIRSLSLLETARKTNNKEAPPVIIALENGASIRIIGDVQYLLDDGALHFGDDKLPSLLKIWPEALVISCALQTSNIYCLKSGKIKTIADPEKALRQFLDYYCKCCDGISPLLPDWADALLRERKMQHPQYEDVAISWILRRLEMPSFEALARDWAWLKNAFSELIALYPAKRAHETV